MLSLMAAVSVHGVVLSACIWLAVEFSIAWRWKEVERTARTRVLLAAAAYPVILLLVVISAWPVPDGVFVTRPNLSLTHLLEATGKTFSGAFTGERISSFIAVCLSIPFLWRGGGLPVFVLSGSLLCGIAGVIYAQVWHQGMQFLAWLFSVWYAANRTKPTPLMLASLVLVIAPQCWWSLLSIGYDWRHAYSGSREAAQYVRQAGLEHQGLYAIGYACTGVQPYFPANVFANVNAGSHRAFWDWSNRNHVNLDSQRLDALRPAYVLVGYKGDFEQNLWTQAVTNAGYRPVRHFEGNLFWKTRILEPESFDLYRRGDLAY
jgi:hypothetical protein